MIQSRERINMNAGSARFIKRRLGVEKKRMIGRGFFTAVYELDEKRVLKITTDRIHYEFLFADQKPLLSFPTVLKDHGQVGSIGNFTAWAYEAEKLEGLRGIPNNRVAARIVRDFDRHYLDTRRERGWANFAEASYHAIQRMKDDTKLPTWAVDALEHIGDFVSNYDKAIADLHLGNFMQRADGTLVFNDPVCFTG